MKKTVIAFAIALGGASSYANALGINQILNLYPNFVWEDDNSETIINRIGSDPFALDVGDSLRGIIEITKIVNVDDPAQFTPLSIGLTSINGNSSLASVFELEVKAKVATATFGLFDYTFGPNAAFEAIYGAGAMMAWYEDINADVRRSNCNGVAVGPGTTSQCEDTVTDGNLILTLGFTGDLDEGWKSFNTPENTNLSTMSAADKFGVFNFALGVLQSTSGDFAEIQTPNNALGTISQGFQNGRVQWTGSGDVLGGLNFAPYTSTSDTDLTASRIPEPATLSLLGIGLVGLSSIRRRKSI